jgi:ABC-type cobalamin/Fe3+-siderophores transport system ATPase subunit
MALVEFHNVSFFYPKMDIEVENEEIRALEDPGEITSVFQHLTLDIPEGIVSLVGENGIGKTTFLLLAGARILPADGIVQISGRDTTEFRDAASRPDIEAERNALVSFVYQNMEFETDRPIGELMDYIFDAGSRNNDRKDLIVDLKKALELDGFLHKRMQVLSKGQMQRAIVAFSVLYGSKLIIMDEPVFALEEPQKERVFEFLADFSSRSGTSIYYSAHNLELTKKYSHSTILFSKRGVVEIGRTEEICTRDKLEAAYQVPMDALYRRDSLYREMLASLSRKKANG